MRTRSGYAVDGFAGSPGPEPRQPELHDIFVNRRWIQSRMLSYAVEEAYLGLLQVKRTGRGAKRHPSLRRRRREFPPLQAGGALPSREPGVLHGAAGRPVGVGGRLAGSPSGPAGAPVSACPHGGRPVVLSAEPLRRRRSLFAQRKQRRVPDTFGPPDAAIPRQSGPAASGGGAAEAHLYRGRGLGRHVLVDQHAAPERVLFDRLLQRSQEKQTEAQALPRAGNLELTPSQAEVLDTNKEALAAYGFDIEPFGDRNYLCEASPPSWPARAPGSRWWTFWTRRPLRACFVRRRTWCWRPSPVTARSGRAGR